MKARKKYPRSNLWFKVPKPVLKMEWRKKAEPHIYKTKSGHWLWTKGVNNQGYGKIGFRFEGVQYDVSVAKLSMHLFVKPVRSQKVYVCHKNTCHNRRCVCPDCVEPGSAKKNARDAIAKGTHACLMKGKKRLTREQVIEIKKLRAEGKTTTWIARYLGISFNTVCPVACGRTYANIKA